METPHKLPFTKTKSERVCVLLVWVWRERVCSLLSRILTNLPVVLVTNPTLCIEDRKVYRTAEHYMYHVWHSIMQAIVCYCTVQMVKLNVVPTIIIMSIYSTCE